MNNTQIVALSIDKVQTFLTETIHAHVQEKQTEEATLKNIMNASKEISEGFCNKLKQAFSVTTENELLSCSGVYIFKCTLPAEEIEDKLDELFMEYYQSSQGQKILRCVTFPGDEYFPKEAIQKDESSSIKAVQEAKKRLKQSQCINGRIEKNKDKLFSFSPVNAEAGGYAREKEYPMFAQNINALYFEEEAENENHFRIAVIKADLDGMGAMFQKIKDFKVYQSVSKVLNEKISLNSLHDSAKACQEKDHKGWLFPFYIAGDDIFFAVSVTNLTKGIDVCKKILQNVNDALADIDLSMRLSMSIGVEITFNREPIRYYMEMVERQLKNAKNIKNEEALKTLEPFLLTKLSIGGLTYLDIDYKEMKRYKNVNLKCEKNKNNPKCDCENCVNKRELNKAQKVLPIWGFFLDDLNRLIYIKNSKYNELLGSTSFFYSLLERLTNEEVQEDDTKYINNLLYHLLPKYINSSDQTLKRLELCLNAGIITQVLKNKGKGMEIILDNSSKHRLETYLRLMLLFSDDRFKITKDSGAKGKHEFRNEEIENNRKYLFTKSINYLYDQLKKKNRSLTDIFARIEKYENKRRCLQRLNIEKSMFIKLRNMKEGSIDKMAEMIQLKNDKDKDVIEKLNAERLGIKKAPYHLYFNKKEFIKLAKQKNTWNTDFIDSLMLLYAYKEMAIQAKKEYGIN